MSDIPKNPEPAMIKITDPNNPPAPVGGGRWEQRGEYLVQVALPTALPAKPKNPKAEVVPAPANPAVYVAAEVETEEGAQ